MASVAAINNLGGYAHNPRGNLWFNDESTYGHKLLMKMGWNKGKGLGKNENGIKENVKVEFRSTNSGLGFKDDAYNNVMKTEYESILKNLASEYSCSRTTNLNKNFKNSYVEPMQKSKVVKSKLRYPKLFFGKDVTKYTEKDMKSIFICSAPLKNIEEKSEKDVILDKKDLEIESPPSVDTHSSSLSISDYFAKKMEEKKNNALNKNYNPVVQTSFECKNSESSVSSNNESKIPERKQKDSQVDIIVKEPNHISAEIESVGSENLASSNKKSSRKRKKSEISVQGDEVNLNEVESCASDFTEKKILQNSFCESTSCSSNIYTSEYIKNQICDMLSKKRKISHLYENESVESSKNTFPSETESFLSLTKKKKKKSKKHSPKSLSSENFLCENDSATAEIQDEPNHISLESAENDLSNNGDCLKKKKKSQKKLKEKLKSCLKRKRSSYSLKSVSFNETVSYRIIDSEIESVDTLACIEMLDENASNDLTDCAKNKLVDNSRVEEKTAVNEPSSKDNVCEKEQDSVPEDCAKEQDRMPEESDEEYSISDLPSSKSSRYNAWIDSQRLALKMQLYKKMLKGIKNHKILSTTNLLSIKGYGNWGYK